jgi:hypothetical protein
MLTIRIPSMHRPARANDPRNAMFPSRRLVEERLARPAAVFVVDGVALLIGLGVLAALAWMCTFFVYHL